MLARGGQLERSRRPGEEEEEEEEEEAAKIRGEKSKPGSHPTGIIGVTFWLWLAAGGKITRNRLSQKALLGFAA
jgi:hypothetical protein